jgi:hypothetical protein
MGHNTVSDVPPLSTHLRITMPFTNNMGESLHFLINGISANLLLGATGVENTLTLHCLGYLFFTTVKHLHHTFSPHSNFPPELAKLKTRFDISGLILVRNMCFNKPTNPPPTLSLSNFIPPLLGVLIKKDSPLSMSLFNAICHVCIINSAKLPLCGRNNRLFITLHEPSPSLDDNQELAQCINTNQCQLHDTTTHKIIRNTRINSNVITSSNKYIRCTTASFGSCLGFLCDFTNGRIDLHLTGLFLASRYTSIFFAQHITSKIIGIN